MQVNDEVFVYSGPYTGYYGKVIAINGNLITVSHKEGFTGFQIEAADLVPPEPEPEQEPENA